MIDNPKIYDKAKWHFDGEYPPELPIENAYTHTGTFLAWLVNKNLLDQNFTADFQEEIQKLQERRISPGKFFQLVDGVFASDMLNDEGNKFTGDYFDFETGRFLLDYTYILSKQIPSFYHVQDTWKNYDLIAKRFDQRYTDWKKPWKRKSEIWNY